MKIRLFSKAARSTFLTIVIAVAATVGAAPGRAAAVRDVAGFGDNILPANDDGSTSAVSMPFTVNFFGNAHNTVFVNNNGNVTFTTGLGTFTPFDLTSTAQEIVAPFFADVDTLAGNVATYGTGIVDGFASFGVNWLNVGYYSQNTDLLNSFQLILKDRSDVGTGDFDIEFNFDQIQWETGDASNGVNGLGGFSARSGYSNGTGDAGTFFELPGSAVPGAFLDGGPNALIDGMFMSDVAGRYIFPVRNGAIELPGLTQDNPFLPNGQEVIPGESLVFFFNNAPSGAWFDPPLVDGFLYEIDSPSLFTDILGFPTGFSDLFDVSVGGSSLGMFGPGDSLDFVSALGSGVSSFVLSSINPLVDSADPLAFPLQLAFDTPTASFRMQGLPQPGPDPIPEPTTTLLLGTGLLAMVWLRRRRA